MINRIKKELIFAFEMLDSNSINFYLKIIVIRDRVNKIIRLNEKVYIKCVIVKYNF